MSDYMKLRGQCKSVRGRGRRGPDADLGARPLLLSDLEHRRAALVDGSARRDESMGDKRSAVKQPRLRCSPNVRWRNRHLSGMVETHRNFSIRAASSLLPGWSTERLLTQPQRKAPKPPSTGDGSIPSAPANYFCRFCCTIAEFFRPRRHLDRRRTPRGLPMSATSAPINMRAAPAS